MAHAVHHSSESVSTITVSISGTANRVSRMLMKEGLARKGAVILARHTLAVVSHGNKGG